MSKVCVAIFVLLSGYGLYKSYEKQSENLNSLGKAVSFTASHLKKLLVQYWWAVLPFAIIGVVTGMRPLSEVYGVEVGEKLAVITDLLGINYILYGTNKMYNVTCWYVGEAIGLYLIFPFLYWLIKRSGLLFCGLSLFLGVLGFTAITFVFLRDPIWILAFSLGIFLAKYEILDAALKQIQRRNADCVIGVISFLIASAFISYCYPIVSDGIFAVGIILFVLLIQGIVPMIGSAFSILGKHSANIFMTHTFFYYYFWPKIFYAPKYPILILLLLLAVCLCYSILLERIKKDTTVIFRKLLQKGNKTI